MPFQPLDKPMPFPTLKPALAANVQISLTCVYISIFGIIFLIAYVQLWMIWYYRHRRLSHQTLFLYLCLIWSGLRTCLFSIYFGECSMPNRYLVLYCVLYVFPVCLQFSMLCLLLHYFAQVVFKSRAKYEPGQYKYPLRIFLSLSVLILTTINMAFAVVTKDYENQEKALPTFVLYLRVSLTESMFLVYGILLSISIYKMSSVAASRRVLEAKGTTVRRAVIATILITFLFLSRTIYNLITISDKNGKKTLNFGYDWINVTELADEKTSLSQGLGYVSFGIVLFVWEVLPITIVMFLFRVKRLQAGQVMTDFSAQSNGSRVFFFDNPRRYDSVDDLSSNGAQSSHHDANSERSANGDMLRSSIPGTWNINSSLTGSLPSVQVYDGIGSYSGNTQRFYSQSARAYYGSLENNLPSQPNHYTH